jgi:CRISPR system Cascade subunit CasE
MFLSRLTLNPRNAQVRRELAHPYEMHRTLSRAFPPGTFGVRRSDDGAAAVLFRVDERPREQLVGVIVQSSLAPDWSYLDGLKDARGHAYLLRPAEAKSFDLRLGMGQVLAFRLRANPTQRVGKTGGALAGKRTGLYAEEEQLQWLERKAQANGFRVLRAVARRDECLQDTVHRENGETHAVKLLAVQFDGLLQVDNPGELVAAVRAGIGSGKGLGFGLLSLAPAQA